MSGDTSPSLTALATVTGLVRNSHTVAMASTTLAAAIAPKRLRLNRCRRIGFTFSRSTGRCTRQVARHLVYHDSDPLVVRFKQFDVLRFPFFVQGGSAPL